MEQKSKLKNTVVSTKDNSKRIAKNSLLLYIRMLIAMFVGFYTSRIILQELGFKDFGMYNVVGGFVAFFQLINAGISSATQRFINFELGKKNFDRLKLIFQCSLTMFIIFALIIVFIAETFGLWFVTNKLNIDPCRLSAAVWVYQASVISLIVNIVFLPFVSIILAHQRMDVYAFVSIGDVFLRLFLVLSLQFLSIDKVVFYAYGILFISLLGAFANAFFVIRTYHNEISLRLAYSRHIVVEMLSFAGWMMFGITSGMCKSQGVNVVLNLFFGTTINAARGVAFQVETAINNFVANFQLSVRPQIIQSYAEGNYEYVKKLVFVGSKFSFYLLFVLSLPVICETDYILQIWLGKVPGEAALFLQIILVTAMLEALSGTLQMSVSASGKIKWYQVSVGLLNFLNLPLAYLLLKFGASASSVFLLGTGIAFIALLLRYVFVQKIFNFGWTCFYIDVVFKCIIVALVSFLIPFFIANRMDEGLIRFICVCVTCVLSSTFFIYQFGLNKYERNYCITLVKKKYAK